MDDPFPPQSICLLLDLIHSILIFLPILNILLPLPIFLFYHHHHHHILILLLHLILFPVVVVVVALLLSLLAGVFGARNALAIISAVNITCAGPRRGPARGDAINTHDPIFFPLFLPPIPLYFLLMLFFARLPS